MRLTNLVVAVFLCSLVCISCSKGARLCRRLENECVAAKREVDATRFISESFENACNGKGFADLSEWQKVCRAIWNLDYIGWCGAEEFMIDKFPEKGTLFYGMWIGEDSSGEVFSRRTVNEM